MSEDHIKALSHADRRALVVTARPQVCGVCWSAPAETGSRRCADCAVAWQDARTSVPIDKFSARAAELLERAERGELVDVDTALADLDTALADLRSC